MQQYNMIQEQQIAIVRVPIKPVKPFRAVTLRGTGMQAQCKFVGAHQT